MIYYRLAIQSTDSPVWRWKSTVLTSLDALFQLLRIYRAIPPSRIRVFFASATEYMDGMLLRENHGLVSNSVTAEQFFATQQIDALAMKRLEEEAGSMEQIALLSTPAYAERLSKQHGSKALEAAEHSGRVSHSGPLEQRRLEVELRPGGDHDVPYTFSLPTSVPQALAWAALLARVQRGELEP